MYILDGWVETAIGREEGKKVLGGVFPLYSVIPELACLLRTGDVAAAVVNRQWLRLLCVTSN